MRAPHSRKSARMDEGCMNPKRREIIADLRHQGMTGKEAYEASKDPELMKEWIRIVISNRKLNVVDMKPKVHDDPGWIKNYIANRTIVAMKKEASLQSKSNMARKRKNFIAKLTQSGLSATKAIRIWEKQHG